MNKVDSILPDSMTVFDHFVVMDLIAKQRLDAIELDAVLVYLIDRVDTSALPWLADQFDVLGYGGLNLATTDQQKREVIKRAIELHRYKGTVWAVKEALKNVGYPSAELIEHADLTLPGGWATFRINMGAGDNVISADRMAELTKMIDEYKNERSHLLDVSYAVDMGEDSFSMSDDSYEGVSDDNEDSVGLGGSFFYDGTYKYDGQQNYSDDTDVLEIQIINV